MINLYYNIKTGLSSLNSIFYYIFIILKVNNKVKNNKFFLSLYIKELNLKEYNGNKKNSKITKI